MAKKYSVALADGRTLTVTPAFVDNVAFETHLRNNRHLGTVAENSMRLIAFQAWAALKRAGETDATFDDFLENQLIDLERIDTDSAEEVEGLGESTAASPQAE